jgi:preprotein translocase subunit SecE
MNKIKNYFVEAYRELKKVIWPNRSETIKHTLLVIAISIAMAIFLGAIDYVFNEIVERIV